MDYRNLLKKYMECVVRHEGVYFYEDWSDEVFSKAEYDELDAIVAEINKGTGLHSLGNSVESSP